MTIKSVFFGFGAWVGRIDGETRCAFWSRHPSEVNYDQVLLVPVDLLLAPATAQQGRIDWDQIQLDDLRDANVANGVTTLGPWFPDGNVTGAVYLEHSYWERLRPEIRPVFPPAGYAARDYEFMTVVYRSGTENPRAGVRYHGYHGRIVSVLGSGKARVAVYPAGSSMGSDPPVEVTVDFGSKVVDARVDEGGKTEIGLGPNDPQEGAIFLDLAWARSVGIQETKKPPGHLTAESSIPRTPRIRQRRDSAGEPVVVPGA